MSAKNTKLPSTGTIGVMRHLSVLLVMLCLSLPWVWADSIACHGKKQSTAQTLTLPAAVSMALPAELPAAVAAAKQAARIEAEHTHLTLTNSLHWQFELGEEFGVIAQASEPDLDDAYVDSRSCRPPRSDNAKNDKQSPDAHEFDLLLLACPTGTALSDMPYVASPTPPLPAPVFRAYRPPSLTA